MTNNPNPTGDKPVVTLLPCPFCGEEAKISYYAKGTSPDVAGYYVECSSCSAGGEPFDIQGEMPDRVDYTKAKAIAAWNTRHREQDTLSREGREAGWIVGNGAGDKWRCWGSVGPDWTDDRDQATRYARRVDAERVHADDEDAWRIVPYSLSPPASEGRDVGWENLRSFGFLPGTYMNVCIGCGEQFEGAKRSIHCIKCAGELAAVETDRITRELDITNADHIALWLEANTIPDEPMSQCISWLSCRIVEAHERALSTAPASPEQADQADVLRERIAELEAALAKRGAMSVVAGGGQKPYLKITFPRLRDVYDANDALLAALKAQEGTNNGK